MAVGLQRAHTNLLGQGEGLAVMGGGLVDIWGLATHGNVAEETVRMRLVAASRMGAGEVAEAFGQILLGPSKPCAHVSRGVTADEILGTAAILGLQAIEYRKLYPVEAADA